MFQLEIDKIAKEIKKRKPKRVLIQLPDGLKNRSQEIVDSLEKKTNAEIFIWLSSCFGACDLPLGLNSIKIDLMVQFGHNRYQKALVW